MRLLKTNQRGAMFGLDARIALAILGALSLVTGTTMFMTIPEVQSKSLLKDIENYRAAIEGMQYDLKTSIHGSITAGGVAEEKAFAALNDRTLILPAAQSRWLGPYLKTRVDDIRFHENYGEIRLHRAERDDYGDNTCAPCFYWLQVDDVPPLAFEGVNEALDDPADLMPMADGRVRYVPEAGAFPAELYVRLGKTL